MDQATIKVTLFVFLFICVTSAPTPQGKVVDIYSFHINSTVTSRYAVTVITSRVANRLNESKEIHFQVQIPKNAFISRFRMTMEGKMYDGVVKEKKEAQQQYSQAVSRGESAGIVSSVGRTLEEFKTSVTVAAFSKVTFELTYEELLKRRLGQYQLLINAQPMQTVADFKIDVYIHESPGISFLEVQGGLNSKELANAVTTLRSDKELWVNFYPTLEQQTKCNVCGPNGMNGDLIIAYDVERPYPSGELKTSHGYFVHYFAPKDIQRLPKNVVFIIDRSGSMHGRKIEQTRDALLRIVGDLAEDDYFGLIVFDSEVNVWRRQLVQATKGNLEAAKAFVRGIRDQGATDINAAVLKGVKMINKHPQDGAASILILLTDGDPTSGETDIGRIQANVKNAIGGKFPLYCLGFGFDVNFEFLQKMALENSGRAVRIYVDSDADLQLQGFYEEVATPLLTNVQLNYTGAGNLTQTTFNHYYNGSEIVVAGQITNNSLESFQTTIIAISKNANVIFQDTLSAIDLTDFIPENPDFIKRLWAYLTVKQLLEKEVTLKGTKKEAVKKKALDLSLQNKFVTPLTSMVVTKPEEEKTQVAHKPKEGVQPHFEHHGDTTKMTPDQYSQIQRFSVPHSQRFHSNRGSRFHSAQLRPGVGNAHFVDTQPVALPDLLITGPAGSAAHDVVDSDLKYYVHEEDGVHSQTGRRDFFSPRVTMSMDTKNAPTTAPPVSSVRFLISSHLQPKPICYDLPAASKLHLLMDTSSDFSMNGLLSHKGFQLIVFRFKNSKHTLTLSLEGVLYSSDQKSERFVWGQEVSQQESDSVTLILRKNEVDVSMGTMRIIVLRHQKNGETFLWPAVRQQPSTASLEGILGKNKLLYEELPSSLIKFADTEVKASWSTAVDYRLPSAPAVGCWLIPFQSILQGTLSDYTVSDV
ncbi:inter-alpha-trypsin inhibitor heavy chain H3-like isoform X2 [Hoplias malabaricus]|uniref:inter-alpha-trypsin inhibitor heavy chain H3-like isoform X2 n=1 Tax=Hoplias malabaricus TaxID=27720 RepID=UPI0034624D1D